MNILLVILLEEEEIVGGSHRYDVLLRVPGGVQDLLVEVQAVHGDLIFFPLPTRTHLETHLNCMKGGPDAFTFLGLSIVFGLATSLDASSVTSFLVFRSNILNKKVKAEAHCQVEDSPEEVVVAPRHDSGVCSVPAAFKLVEDAVVLV